MLNDAAHELARYGPRVVAGVFIALLILETALPLRARKRARSGRYFVNACVTAVAFAAGTYIVRRIALELASWCEGARFGLLHMFSVPYALKLAAGFLMMDLTFYYWHRVNHTVGLLWRFHNVHHVDPDLDVTTSFRFHFMEVLFSTGFRALQVALIGVSPFTYAVYEVVFTCETAFHHSNLRLPVRLERVINKVLVTPRMHGIHHSSVRDETNSNYSVIFRWWDILNGSLRLDAAQSDVNIGVPAYLGPEDNRVSGLLALPFVGQREYWRFPDGRTSLTRAGAGARDRALMRE